MLAVLLVLVVVLAVAIPATRANARQRQDSAQLRSLGQSLVVWCNSNQSNYPFPSKLDMGDATVPESGVAKDTTANIFSIMLWIGHYTPEMLVSPLETNPNIRPDNDFAMTNPPAAVRPADALWDPAFNADFTDPTKPGNMSYAHLMLQGKRRDRWSDTFSSEEAVMSTRGPRVTGVTYAADGDVSGVGQPAKSNTYLFLAPHDRWAGHVFYNDGHVALERSVITNSYGYTPEGGRRAGNTDGDGKRADVLFFNEPDDPTGHNLFLSIFTKMGETPEECVSIWD